MSLVSEAVTPAVALGRITGESSEEYHKTDAVSASKLRVFRRKPGGAQLYYQHYIAKTIERVETEAMRDGQALHTLVLEPEKFIGEYAVAPVGIDRRTKAGKEAWAEFQQQAAGKKLIEKEKLDVLETMAAQVNLHPLALKLLSGGEAEISWRVKGAGLKYLPPQQCRTDWFNEAGCELSEGRPYVMDVKTCATLDEDAFSNFQRGFEEHGYHRQAALYMAILNALGVECRDFFFIAVEKVPPYGVMVYRLNDRALERGQVETERDLLALNDCYRFNLWPNTPLSLQELKLSARYYGRKEDEWL